MRLPKGTGQMPISDRLAALGWQAGKVLVSCLLVALAANARKFYSDDPLPKVPPLMNVETAVEHDLDDYYDFFLQTFAEPGEQQAKKKGRFEYVPAGAVNTLGEVPDDPAWFTNRIDSRPMTIDELTQGPRRGLAPSPDGPWTIVSAKTEGVTPGFTIQDAAGRRYLLKFDPLSNPEMTTAVDVIGPLFFHALGYNVPENYLVTFTEDKFTIREGTTVDTPVGGVRPMTGEDVALILRRVPVGENGIRRGVASLYLSGVPAGPFRYHDTRPDDPNDIVLHEHRRDLRGLFVFAAWLGHDDSRAINTLDVHAEENGVKFIKHHLIDFGSILGSASEKANSPRSGNEFMYSFKPAAIQVLTLGLYVPKWVRLDYQDYPSIGLFDYRIFDPEKYRPEYPNPAFDNRLPDDTFWGAKKVMAFTDDQIRAIVAQGEYSNPEAEAWLVRCLIERRNIIGRTYFAKVLPLDNFAVRENRLVFEDLAVKYGFEPGREHQVEWSRFDNDAETHTPIAGATSFDLPPAVSNGAEGSYFAARITGSDASKTVMAYLRKETGGIKVVGIDRTW